MEVVKNRLAANGLAPFCLELHSNKNNRKNVLAELAKTLDYKFVGNYDSQSLSKILADIKALKKLFQSITYTYGIIKIFPL